MDELLDPNVKVFVLAHNPACSRNDITDTLNSNSSLSSEQLHLIGAKRTFDLLKKHNKQVIIVKDNPTLPFAPQNVIRDQLFSTSNYVVLTEHSLTIMSLETSTTLLLKKFLKNMTTSAL